MTEKQKDIVWHYAVEERFHTLGCRTFVFDGDNVRHGLCSDFGF